MTNLQLKFDPNQEYQLEAIESVTGLFEGMSPHFTSEAALGEEIVSNLPPYQSLAEGWLFDNLRLIQEEFNQRCEERGDESAKIALARFDLEMDDGLMLERVSSDSWRCPHFTVEMETGTGKTYVYLRTIYELRKLYGFSKYIIVVPSRAIYEGTVKSFEITRSHFRALYGNENINLYQYDSAYISRLRTFATSSATDILVITLHAFNRYTNNLYKPTEKLPGERLPYQFIQETRPIIILDEPQNMESERSKEAIRTLKPLFVLRYSATHRSVPNLTYRLTPFEAWRRGLVKKISVYGVTERDDLNRPMFDLTSIEKQSGKLTATVLTYRNDKGQIKSDWIKLKHGDNLWRKTRMDEHKGVNVEEINAKEGYLLLDNGQRLMLGESQGITKEAIFREQIRQTIKQHMEQQLQQLPLGIKVLSLFFIDRVANYTSQEEPLIKNLFDEEFNKLKRGYAHFQNREAHEVREGYFAQRRVKKEDVYVDTSVDDDSKTKKDREAEREAYRLIMKGKEDLLSFERSPVCFIFAHSALKEGWDNPNVFQICTLNQTVSVIRKRQEIGRGLRLCVNQRGERVFDDEVNILTVIANQSYKSYAETLQNEYVEEGHAPPPRATNARAENVTRNPQVFKRDEFKQFWDKLMRRTRYKINIDTPHLIEECVKRVNRVSVPEPVLVVEKGNFVQTEYRIRLQDQSDIKADKVRLHIRILDTDDNLQETRNTYKRNSDLAKIFNDQRLRGYKIKEINPGEGSVEFANGDRVTVAAPIIFQSEAGQGVKQTRTRVAEVRYPVFNLLDRTAKETGITRPTINQIFKQISDRRKQQFLQNPEGFAGVFITEVRNAVADHVATHIEFEVTDEPLGFDIEEFFPVEKRFPQKELIEAGDNSVYDYVQIDSNEEVNFVNWRLKDQDDVLFYFKFPPKFKIGFPKVIGNYNPDWGIVRLNGDKRPVIELVRETKGTVKLDDLQFPQEKRKIVCAQKYFDHLGVDYRHVKANLNYWYLPDDDPVAQRELGI